jgi:hypothetical protein
VLRLKNGFHVGHQFQTQHAKFWASVVNGGQAHGPQNSIWNRRWARYLQEVAARWVKIKLKHLKHS